MGDRGEAGGTDGGPLRDVGATEPVTARRRRPPGGRGVAVEVGGGEGPLTRHSYQDPRRGNEGVVDTGTRSVPQTQVEREVLGPVAKVVGDSP